MKKRTKRILNIIAVIVLISGIASFCVPYVTRFLSDKKAGNAITQYKTDIDSAKKEPTKLDELYEKISKYNEDIYMNGQSGLKDQYSYEESLFDLSDYGIKDDVYGYISIPRIDVELPIYLGATWDNMALGAARTLPTHQFLLI